MAGDGEPQEDGGGSESSDSSASTSSTSPRPPPPPPPPPVPAAFATLGPPPPPTAPASSSSAPIGAAPLPLPPHLYHQRLLSLHLSPAASPALPSQPRPPHTSNSEPSPAPLSDRPFREDCWSENATLTLIQAWGDRYLELNRGNLKQKHWKDVADSVNARPLASSKPPKTDVQCKNRLDTLKKKYKIEKSKLVTGGAPSKWAFFDRIDELIGSSKKPKTSGKVSRSVAAVADANCTSNPADGLCMAALPAAKCAMEEDVKPPLFFFPPQATIAALPPPPMNHHHVGGVVVHMNHHLGNVLHLNHHVGAPIIHHLAGEGALINHHAGMPLNHLVGSAACAAAVNHQVGDCGGGGGGGGGGDDAAAATDTGSKSKAAGPDMSQSSPAHKRPDKRRLKRKRDSHRSKEDGPLRDLARAICKFGDVYERVEMAKLEQETALEKQRREFARDLEIQRMQLFTQMQIERAKTNYESSKHGNAENPS